MEQPKYSPKPSIPAVEVSPRALQEEIETAPPQKEPNPPAPIELEDDDNEGEGNAVKADQNGLRVMQDEGGKEGSLREITEPAPPAAVPERK